MYLGSWKIDDLLTFYATTTRFDTGAATDADSVPSYHVYEDETATPLITGTMALLNGANTIGFYSEQITLSAANGFEKGKSYAVYIQATVNSVTAVTYRNFQVEAEVDANVVSDKTGYSLSSPQSFNLNGNITGTFTGNILGSVQSVTNPVGINTGTFMEALADKVWDEFLSGHLVAGSAGHTLFSRMPTGTVLVGDKTGFSLSSPQAFDLIGNVSGTITNVLNVVNPVVAGVVTGSVFGNVNGSVGSVVNSVGISTGTFFDALADKVWDEPIAGHLTAGTVGNALNSAGSAGDPWGTLLPGSYTPGQAGHILASRMPTGTVVVGQNNDKTGYSLSTPQSFDLIGNISGTISNTLSVVNPVTAGVVTGSVLGNLNGSVIGNVNGSVNSVAQSVVAGIVTGSVLGNVNGNVAGSVNSVTQPVVAGVVTGSVLGNVNGSVGSVVSPVGINTGTFIGAIADGVWDETLAGHLSAGSAGNALNSAGSAGDPWSTSLPGSYVPGQAGHILASRMPTGTVFVGDKTGFSLSNPQNFNLIGNISGTITNTINVLNPVGLVTGTYVSNLANLSNLDVAVSTRASQTSLDTLDDLVDTEVAAIKAKTDNLPANPAAVSDIPTANQNADALLKRDWTAVTGEAARSVLNALRFIRNKFSTTATPGSVTVYKEDDTTVAYTKSVTTDPDADPIVEG